MAYFNFYARVYSAFGKIKESLAAIFHFRPSFIYIAAVLLEQLLAWFQAWFIYHNLSGDILVLHYNVDFGIDLVGDPVRIYFFPAISLAIFLLNFIILAIFHKDKNFKILAHYLLGIAALFGLFLSIALLSVYLINFR